MIFDRLRKQYVRLTPEEYVRQHFVNYLIENQHYPEALLANEIQISLGNVKKRCDTILYNKHLEPLVLIEYKAPNIEITQAVFDQIIRYNMKLKVPWIIVSNGLSHFCCKINYSDENYRFEKEIPSYEQLTIDN